VRVVGLLRELREMKPELRRDDGRTDWRERECTTGASRVRPDVARVEPGLVEPPPGHAERSRHAGFGTPLAVYDLKTGSAVLTPARVQELREGVGVPNIEVIELRYITQTAVSR
jgi:hypothetical protein